MIALIEACDAYGLDNISTGGVLAFTTEAVEKGALKPTDLDGLKPKWGDGETYMEMIRKIAYKEGKAGKLLAQGVGQDVQADRQGHRCLRQHGEGQGTGRPRPAGRQDARLQLHHGHLRRRSPRRPGPPGPRHDGHGRLALHLLLHQLPRSSAPGRTRSSPTCSTRCAAGTGRRRTTGRPPRRS